VNNYFSQLTDFLLFILLFSRALEMSLLSYFQARDNTVQSLLFSVQNGSGVQEYMPTCQTVHLE